jgi:hypothetical protein
VVRRSGEDLLVMEAECGGESRRMVQRLEKVCENGEKNWLGV